jgi:hypothetical protein
MHTYIHSTCKVTYETSTCSASQAQIIPCGVGPTQLTRTEMFTKFVAAVESEHKSLSSQHAVFEFCRETVKSHLYTHRLFPYLIPHYH